MLKGAGKLVGGIASAFESLLGGASKPAKDDNRIPLDAGTVPPKAEIDEASHREHEQKSARRQKYLRDHSREVPDEIQRDADITKGRERTRGE